jgi:hypothetical protein
MKNLKFNPSALAFNLVVCVFMFSFLSPIMGLMALLPCAILLLISAVPRNVPAGLLRNEVVMTLFSSQLQKNLYPDSEFYKDSRVDAGVGVNALAIEVPQAGARPNVIKNPQQLPVASRVRSDDKKTYLVDHYVTEVDIVTDINQAFASYDKKGGILEDHQATLNQRIADELQIIWATTKAANIIRTTGANGTGSAFGAMTGTRKEITYNDIINVATLMDRMNIPDDGRRRVLFYTDQIAEVKRIAEFRDYDKTGLVGQLASGAIGRLQNFQVYKRSIPVMYDNTPAKRAYGATLAATDNIAAIFWHPDYVRRAEGLVQVYYESKKVGYQGDIMNAALRGGGMISRLDEAGVIALVQQA